MAETVVIISAAYPFPVDSGKRVVLSGLVEYFAARSGPENLHYVQIADDDPVQLPEAHFQYHRVRRGGTAAQVVSVLRHAVVRREKSIQESLLYSRVAREELSTVLRHLDADLEIFDTVRTAQFAAEIPSRPHTSRIVYLDDLFSLRYDKMGQALRTRPDVNMDPLGEFRRLVPGPLRSLIQIPRAQQRVLAFESRRIARSEVAAVAFAQRSLLINEHEVELLRARTGSERIDVMPPYLPQRAHASRDQRQPPEFVFLGLLTLPHNDVAIRAFLARHMTDVVRLLPEARVRVVGRGAGADLLALAAEHPQNVTIEGFVEDLDDVLAGATALLNPLLFGTGVKLKALEALARGLPVISTSVGAEGVGHGPDEGIVVEDNLDRWPQHLVALADVATNARISEAARSHFQRTFGREAVRALYDGLFTSASGTEPARHSSG